jgi:F-type H+-transporting ATPase subunit delta
MKALEIGRRYGRALYELAADKDELAGYLQELTSFVGLLQQQQELACLLANPVFTADEKKEILEELFTRISLSVGFKHFLLFLNDRKRMDIIDAIEESYRSLVDEALGIARVKVTVAMPPVASLVSRLQEDLSLLTKRRVEITLVEDPTLLGGMIIALDDLIFDASLKNDLRRLERELLTSLPVPTREQGS